MKGDLTCEAYADGCRKMDGAGGWGALIYIDKEVIFIGDYGIDVTNNMMELQGPLEILKTCNMINVGISTVIHSDSKYFVDGFNSWMEKWKKFGWTRNENSGEVKNLNMWKELYDMKHCEDVSKKAKWLRGHSGHLENEVCDLIANHCCKIKQRVFGIIKINEIENLNHDDYFEAVISRDKELKEKRFAKK